MPIPTSAISPQDSGVQSTERSSLLYVSRETLWENLRKENNNMKVNQVYSLVNAVNKDMWGSTALSVKDLSGLISLGKSLEIDEDATDAYLNKLVDRIGKTVVRTLDLELDFPNLFMDEYSFGCVLQKITANPFDAIANSDWQIGENGFNPTFADIHKPSVSVKYFQDSQTFAYVCTVPNTLFFTAFLSESAMSNFVDAIIKALSDSMIMAINNMSRMAITNMIGEKFKAGNGIVNLLTLYNATVSNPISASNAIYNKDFLRFAGMIIRNYIGYMEEPSTMYNVDGTLRVTKRDNMHCLMLKSFASAYVTNYGADTFHEELTRLPMYTEVNHWQGANGGSGLPDFTTDSTINIKVSSSEDGASAINQTGVVCVLADRQAIAVGLNKRRTGKFLNNIDDYTNIKTSATIQFLNDLSENCVVMIIADDVSLTLNKSTLTFANSSADAQSITATTVPDGETVTWSTSKATVATVSNGTVTPVGAGTCVITASFEKGGLTYTATCNVTVGSSNSKSLKK